MNLQVGDKVKHAKFGVGEVVELHLDYADVNFELSGKKSIVYSALEELEKPKTRITYESRVEEEHFSVKRKKVVSYLLYKMEAQHFQSLAIEEVMRIVGDHFSGKITEFELLAALGLNGKTIYKRGVKKTLFLLRIRRLENSNVDFYNPVVVKEKHEVPLIEKKAEIPAKPPIKPEDSSEKPKSEIKEKANPYPGFDEFVDVCTRAEFNSTSKLYLARCIIHHFRDSKLTDQDFQEYSFKKLCDDFLNCYLYQASAGEFRNNRAGSTQYFLQKIYESVDDNLLTDEEKADLCEHISGYLHNSCFNSFNETSHGKTDKIFAITDEGNLQFATSTVKRIIKNADYLDTSIINRLNYFLSKYNNPELVKGYISGIRRKLDKKEFVLKFEYENELNEMLKHLDSDFYMKSDFKAIMKDFGIPGTENYLKMCLDRSNFTLRTKRIILNNKYQSLKAYYKEQILKDEVYRYSNPLNLDEYDFAMKLLIKDLVLIHVENEVYLTRLNMEKNGVDDVAIETFHKRLKNLGRDNEFFSLKKITETYPDDPVILYCGGSKHQLMQFLDAFDDIRTVFINKSGAVFTYSFDKDFYNKYIKFLMNGEQVADIYDLIDFANQQFGVEYDIEEIIKDVLKSSYYYSEDMEKVYKYKRLYLEEVYGDGN